MAATESVFAFRSRTDDQAQRCEIVREGARHLLDVITETVPASAERTLAMRDLETTVDWAVKAIIHNGERYLP